MDEMVTEFNKSLIINSTDAIQEYLEIGVDKLLENKIATELPVIKTIVGAGKIVKTISEKNLIKNLILFINELNCGSIDKEKLEKHRKKLNENHTKAEKELGRILIILDKTIDNQKSIFLGKVYKAYINQKIDWELFIEFSEIINRIFIQDFKVLKLLYLDTFDSENKNDMFKVERMISLGIIGFTANFINQTTKDSKYNSFVGLNNMGKIFCNIIFN